MQSSVNEFLKPRVVKVHPVAPRQARVVIEPFERGSRADAISGTGLGLTIMRRLCDLLGGTIRIDPTVDVGTRFVVDLPHRPAPAPPPA